MKAAANLLMLFGTSVLTITIIGFVAKAYWLLFLLGWEAI